MSGTALALCERPIWLAEANVAGAVAGAGANPRVAPALTLVPLGGPRMSSLPLDTLVKLVTLVFGSVLVEIGLKLEEDMSEDMDSPTGSAGFSCFVGKRDDADVEGAESEAGAGLCRDPSKSKGRGEN